MIRAVFFDIDGTLITDNNHVLPSTEQSIHCLQKKGYIVGIATSRGPNMLPKSVKKLPFDYWVTFNGQLIYNKAGKVIHQQPLSKEQLTQVFNYANHKKHRYLLQGNSKNYGSFIMKIAQSEWGLPIIQFLRKHLKESMITKICKFSSLFSSNISLDKMPLIYQVTLMQSMDEDEHLINAIPKLKVTRSNPFTAEMISQNTSKAEGIQRAISSSQLSLEEVLFFGDNYNDIEVMKKVKYGVAMGNGIPELREDASFVTRANNSDGIYYALRYFHLIEKGDI